MSADLEFSGERFVPGIAGEIAHEHWHRYAFARRFATGKTVLDVACGEGYGSALLSSVAGSVVGVDIAEEVIAHARGRYAQLPNLRFLQGSATRLPLADASVDVVVSFETIEHLPAAEQPHMLAEIARVLTASGILLLSTPNPAEYSQARNYRNPFHLHEPARDELDAALAVSFPVRHWYRQRRYFGSALWSEGTDTTVETWSGDAQSIDAAPPPAAMYFLVLAMRNHVQGHDALPGLSLFSDRDDIELSRVDSRAAEVIRLDALLKEGITEHERQAAHVLHLETLVAYRDRLVEERDGQLVAARETHEQMLVERDLLRGDRDAIARERDAMMGARDHALKALAETEPSRTAFQAEALRLERAIVAQERIIAYRQSVRWWLTLPWMRVKLWWIRVTGA